jgi:hypothetical protein
MSVTHDALKKAGHIVPWVFWRMVANGRRGPKKPQPIVRLVKAWKRACLDAGCPRRIPHDPRRTAVRNLTRVGVATAVAKKITTTLSARETYATRLNCWTRRHLIDAVHSCPIVGQRTGTDVSFAHHILCEEGLDESVGMAVLGRPNRLPLCD